MFKIAKTNFSKDFGQGSSVSDAIDHETLKQFCITEAWSGDLSNGIFHLGAQATHLHGLRSGECGLLNLVRCYDSGDRTHIVALFEQAATISSSFCFTTTVILASGGKQPVFCIGESTGLEKRYSGSILGMFFFPRFQLETRNRHLTQ